MLAAAAAAGAILARSGRKRWQLSRAKDRSLAGHARVSRRLARLIPFYEYNEERFFAADDAPPEIARRRRDGFARLARTLADRAPKTIARGGVLAPSVSDLQFTTRYRVPFQFARHVAAHLKTGAFLQASGGVMVEDLDGNAFYDLTGSYGVNLFGYDFYKECIDAGVERVRSLGPVLGAYHPIVLENVEALKDISGLDEVSFHMSGTEAVMQAVRLARYHTRRSHVASAARITAGGTACSRASAIRGRRARSTRSGRWTSGRFA
jgi:glutamate-1-semialdehyde 2,1-aminomutase